MVTCLCILNDIHGFVGLPSILDPGSTRYHLCTQIACHARLAFLCWPKTHRGQHSNCEAAQLANIDDVPSFSSEPPDEASSKQCVGVGSALEVFISA